MAEGRTLSVQAMRAYTRHYPPPLAAGENGERNEPQGVEQVWTKLRDTVVYINESAIT